MESIFHVVVELKALEQRSRFIIHLCLRISDFDTIYILDCWIWCSHGGGNERFILMSFKAAQFGESPENHTLYNLDS